MEYRNTRVYAANLLLQEKYDQPDTSTHLLCPDLPVHKSFELLALSFYHGVGRCTVKLIALRLTSHNGGFSWWAPVYRPL